MKCVMPLLLIAASLLMAQSAGGPADEALLDALVWGGPLEVPSDRLTPAIRGAWERYETRWRAYRSPRKSPPGRDWRMVHDAWVSYERRLAAISGEPRGAALASSYVDELRPCYEWEGSADCPEREARFAATYVAAHPDAPFRELLMLIEAHRRLCAAEAHEFEKRTEAAAGLRQSYAQVLQRAKAAAHPLIAAAAGALDARARCHRR